MPEINPVIFAVVGIAVFGVSVSILARVTLWVLDRRALKQRIPTQRDHELDTLDDLLSGRS